MRIVLFAAIFTLASLAHADLGQQLEEAHGFTKQERTSRGGITSDRVHLPFYGVKIEAGKLLLQEEVRKPNGLVSEIQGKHFKFIAHDRGEFGGGLEAIGPTGIKTSLGRENVKGFFRLRGDIYALTGLAHLAGNRGALHRIDEVPAGARLVLVTRLTGAPEDVIVEDNTVLVLTNSDLEVLHFYKNDLEFFVLVHDGPWDGVSSNMAKTDTQIAIGMHAGVVVVNLGRWKNSKASYQYYGKPGDDLSIKKFRTK